jgi:hypothetical protein
MSAKPKAAHVWERDPHDWYVEPEAATRQLLEREAFPGWTHDPCCGQGNIVRTLLAAGLTATGSDLIQRVEAPWHMGVADFLDGSLGAFGADNVVSNPPYYGAVGAAQAIRNALDVAPGKAAMFIDARFLFGQGRARELWTTNPPSRIHLLGTRPSCPPGAWLAEGNVASGGVQNYAWLIWDARPDRLTPGGMPRLGWLT